MPLVLVFDVVYLVCGQGSIRIAAHPALVVLRNGVVETEGITEFMTSVLLNIACIVAPQAASRM